ncbi:MAG: response regulator [Nisaea sp.]|uniref:ATP-binding protein n=1 Tax=Nisaea sp. TaxID=2024842 RepID=UPI001B18AA55|nr:ATP-binding protein [Nisaea sp.]MBO6559199.1 response regulator [Nisaea sp.]
MKRRIAPSFVILLTLGSVLFCGTIISIVFWNQKKLEFQSYELVAEAYSNSISTFREFYGTVILDRVRSTDIDVTHDYLARENAIPIPATMTLDLTQFLNSRNANVNLRVTSEFPFPWRSERKLTDFEKEALSRFRSSFDNRYSRLSETEDGEIFRFATPIRMKENCVACHNSHPSSPKTDWKIGDIRGLQVVSIDPNQGHGLQNPDGAYFVVIATLLFFGFTFSVIFWLLSKNNLSFRLLIREKEQHQKAREEAERSSQAKTRFLGVVSHEMRTPLNAVNGMLREIEYATSDERILKMARVAHASSDMLCGLIEDVIDVTRLENDKFTFNPSDFSIQALIDEVASLLAERARDRGNTVEFVEGSDDTRYVRSDRNRLKQVLVNLVGNAIKFTQQGMIVIGFRLQPEADGVRLFIDVSDTGKGVAPEEIDEIFDRFYQSRVGDGLGLGLWISKDIINRLGGDITVSSELGQGSRFTVSIPVTLAERPALPSDTRIFGQPLDGITLLVAEDNSTNRYVIDHIIGRLGGAVEFAEDGEIAVSKALRKRYDVILMDINMPGMDGMTAFGKISEQAGTAMPPVIALTANALAENVAEYLGIGMKACVTKPIDEADLIAAVLAALGRSVPEFMPSGQTDNGPAQLSEKQKNALADFMSDFDDS